MDMIQARGVAKATRPRQKTVRDSNRWSTFGAPKPTKGMSDAYLAAMAARDPQALAKEWRAFRKSLPKGVRV